jgi:hypothetical protein
MLTEPRGANPRKWYLFGILVETGYKQPVFGDAFIQITRKTRGQDMKQAAYV